MHSHCEGLTNQIRTMFDVLIGGDVRQNGIRPNGIRQSGNAPTRAGVESLVFFTPLLLDLAIFSSQEALSLHFSFKMGVTIQINLLSSTGPQRIKATLY